MHALESRHLEWIFYTSGTVGPSPVIVGKLRCIWVHVENEPRERSAREFQLNFIQKYFLLIYKIVYQKSMTMLF